MESWLESLSFRTMALIIVLTGICVYGTSLSNGFVSLDDGLLILKNPAVLEMSMRSVWHMFTSYDPELYVPLTLLSYQLEHAVFGLQPGWFHFTSLCLHLASALLVYCIGFRLSGRKTVGLLTALLFVVHPLNTEAVAWAAARKDVLSGFFCFGAIVAFLLWKDTGKSRYRWLCVFAFFLGLLAKVSIISLPVVLMAIAWSRRESLKQAVLEQWPLWLLSALFGLIAVYGKSDALQSAGPLTTMLLACKSIAFYILKIFLPTSLSVIYPQMGTVTMLSPEIFASITIVVGLLVTCILVARYSRKWAAGLLIFLTALPPNFLNFSKNGDLYFASDRYVYIAGVGIFLCLAMLADTVLQRAQTHWIRRPVVTVLLAIFLVLGWLSVVQARTWRDSPSLYTQAVTHYPHSWLAWNNLGQAYAENKNDTQALSAFRQAESLKPNSSIVLVNIGNVFRRKGNVEQAAQTYRQSIQTLSGRTDVREEDLVAYYYLGALEEARGNSELSLAAFEAAATKAPTIAEPHYNLGLQYQKRGDDTKAMAAFQKAIGLKGDIIDARYRLAAMLAATGQLKEALLQLEEVERRSPGYENTSEHIANLREMLRR